MRAYTHLLQYRRVKPLRRCNWNAKHQFHQSHTHTHICLSFSPSHVHICLFLSSSAPVWVEQSDVSITASTSHCFPIHKTGSSVWEVGRQETSEREIEHSLVLLSGSRRALQLWTTIRLLHHQYHKLLNEHLFFISTHWWIFQSRCLWSHLIHNRQIYCTLTDSFLVEYTVFYNVFM